MTSRANSKRRSSHSKLGLVLDTSDTVLTTLKDAARLAPVPYLQEAAGLALGIINIIEGVKSNKDAFQRLANDTCGLVYAIILSINGSGAGGSNTSAPISPALLDNLRELLATLSSIERFSRKQTSRISIVRMIKYKSDLGTIQEYRETLRVSLDLFGLKSNISIQENIARIAKQQEDFMNELREREAKNAAEKESREREKTERETKERERREIERKRMEEEQKEMKKSEKGRIEMERLEKEKERLRKEASDREKLEREKSEQERLEAEKLSPYDEEQQWYAPKPQWARRSPPMSPKNPFHYHEQQSSFFPFLSHANGNFTVTSIGGDHNISSNNVTNTNSGNTTTTVISNSNNDSSVRTFGSPWSF